MRLHRLLGLAVFNGCLLLAALTSSGAETGDGTTPAVAGDSTEAAERSLPPEPAVRLDATPAAGTFAAGTDAAGGTRQAASCVASDSDLLELRATRPGPWRQDLKREELIHRMPGHESDPLFSRGPSADEVVTEGRWVPGYRPATPEAQAKFEQWKGQERLRQAVQGSAVPRAPQGTPASNLWAGGASASSEEDEDEIVHTVRQEEYPGSPIDLRALPTLEPEGPKQKGPPSDYHKSGLTWREYNQLKQLVQSAPPTAGAQEAPPDLTRAPGAAGVSFVALPSTLTNVPPDPIMAVGPNHIVAIVNSRYRVWNKGGSPVTAEISLNTFFSGISNCGGAFDVFVDYDEQNDRFVMGGMTLVGSPEQSYLCVGGSNTNDPTGVWNRFSFRSDAVATGTAMDFPHMGIGLDAVYVAGNMFTDGGGFNHVRLFALDKTDLYTGTPLSVAEASVGGSFITGQPVKLHGFSSGGWPSLGTPHHIIASNLGGLSRIWRWSTPFTSAPVVYGTLAEAFNGAPPNAPEQGGTSANLNDSGTGDWLDAEYRGGRLWSTRGVGCNLGGGAAESCVDWLVVDVTGASPVLLDQQSGGAYGSANDFRYYPDVAVDRNNNIAIGYTKSSSTTFTQIWVTGREFSDPAGTLQVETLQRAGLGNYTDGAGCNGGCDRWGDYTGMTVDPDGCTFWYLGEYSDGGASNWSTHVGSFKFSSCSVQSSINLDRGTYTCTGSLTVTVTDTTRISAATVSGATSLTTAGDSETILPGAWTGSDCVGADCGTWTATLAVSGSPGAPNNGTLNVANGGTISAVYADPHGGHSTQTRTAAVSCQTRFDDGGYLIDGGCELGAGTELYRDYMDGGEYIAYSFGIFNPQSAPALTDMQATLSVSGPAAAKVTIFNPTLYIGPVGQGTLTAPVFQIFIDPSIDTAALRLSANDFNLSVTSVADGYTVPQLLTQQQLLQTDDNIVSDSQCFNFESGTQGFVNNRYVFSYLCGAAEGCTPSRTINTVTAPWTRGSGCASETRSDYPEMTCDGAGSNAFKTNSNAALCNNFAQSASTLADDINYSPIFGPAHIGNAPNGQPWNFQWLLAEWFYRSDMASGTAVAAAWGHFWDHDYEGVAAPAENEIDILYPFFLGYFTYDNQNWDSGTAWDPDNPPANYDAVVFPATASGLATSGTQWRWAVEVFDADFGGDPTATPATPGMSIDDMNLSYAQFHAQAQVGTCGSAVGTLSFDQFSYQECVSGTLGLSVLDGNAAGPVTVTVSSDGTGDSETVVIAGPGPYFAGTLPYSTAGGAASGDGILFVTPSDTVRATYGDSSPSGTASATALVACSGGDVVVDGISGLQDNGDADTYADTNEIVNIAIRIRNNREQPLTNVMAFIDTADPDVDCILKNSASFGNIAENGGTAVNSLGADPFTFKVSNATACSDPASPPTVTFNVFIVADGFAGPSVPQKLTLTLDLNDLPGTVTLTEDFTTNPVRFVHQLGPGDDDGITSDPSGFSCSPYADRFFWRATGGNPGGGYFCWQNPADSFPNGNYGDLSDSALYSPVVKIGAASTTLRFDHEYKFGSTSTLRVDAARVDYSVNGGAWQKMTTLTYDGPLIFNSYCNPLCNGGQFGLPCFSENATDGENVFALLSSGTRNWTNTAAALSGLTAGDQIQFRWRVGSMSTSLYGISTLGGYGLDNVSITNVVEQACDAAVHPDVGCGVSFLSSGNLTEVCGDGDAVVEPTEQWSVDVTLENLGSSSAVGTVADLVVNGGSAIAATVTGNPGSYGTIAGDGGTGSASYQFAVDGAAVCVDDITFDVDNIADNARTYPDETAAFTVPVGMITGSQTANQSTSPLSAAAGSATSNLAPALTLTVPVNSATVSYGFNYLNSAPSETANQSTSPLNAMNATAVSTLAPVFTLPGGTATAATVNWASLTFSGNLNNCVRVFLRKPNATDVDLKPFGTAPANPYNVLAIYQGAGGGPGQYSIGVQEQVGGGCNGTASLSATSMIVTGTASAGSWTANARVSLGDGTTFHVLKPYGAADANPYNVTSIYNAAGPGTYQVRIEENGGGGTAQLSAGSLMVQTIQCDSGCAGAAPPAPPLADGTTGTGLRIGKGAGTNELVFSIDNTTCSSNHAVVLYGTLGNFSGYQGTVDVGCNISTGPTAVVVHAGSNVWFNVIWVNADGEGGHPGFATSGPRTWPAAGLCGVAADDPSDGVCN